MPAVPPKAMHPNLPANPIKIGTNLPPDHPQPNLPAVQPNLQALCLKPHQLHKHFRESRLYHLLIVDILLWDRKSNGHSTDSL
jgi:hypothetical protein